MKSVALVDLRVPGKRANRDHAGGFGAFMTADGALGGLVSRLKAAVVELPVLHEGYLAGIFAGKGWRVRHVDGGPCDEDLVLIASSMHCHAEELAYARALKAARPASRIGFYGPLAIAEPERFDGAADFLVRGEVEAAALSYFEGRHDFTGRVDCGIVADLDALPEPRWDGVDVRRFSYFPLLHRRPLMAVQSMRGCSFDCDFCPYMVEQTARFRRRDPRLVVDGIERLARERGVRSVLFRDICFTLDKRHAEAVARELLRRRLDLEWACETRVDCLTPELIDLLHAAGMRGVNLGLETGDLALLAAAGKRHPPLEAQARILAALSRRGVRVNAFYMLGLPGDTPESMGRTSEYARSLNTLGAQFNVTTPYPGTKLRADPRVRDAAPDPSAYGGFAPAWRSETARPEDVRRAAAAAYRYYARPAWLVEHGAATAWRLLVNATGL